MEETKTESERVRLDVAEKCERMGIKKTRHLTLAEGREFLASGKFPASALGRTTFVKAKRLESLPQGSACMCCKADLSGKPGYVVQMASSPSGAATFGTICDADYDAVMAVGGDASAAQAVQDAPAQVPSAESAAAPATSVESALQTLAAALAAKNAKQDAPKVDEAKIVAEAVKAAKDAAQEEAKGFMQKSIADFIRDGSVPTQDDACEAEAAKFASATGDGVEASANASSWSAKATPKALEAVEKLNKFLSEFSYFQAGVSMRLINTFARAKDKAAALRSYCEVSQMEDLPDLIEKMKSPEFGEVCDAFAPFAPKSLNSRFAVFYGNPGGGKTYAAQKAGEAINGGKCDMIICHAGMDSADMLYAYRLDYKSGKRGYVPTALLSAMLNGRAVVLDEVNTLPMESRMFLQDILDNKESVHVMGVEIPIRKGFFVIGTMNPETGLGAQPLPLPLVDRAAVVREFRTTTAQAAVGAGLC